MNKETLTQIIKEEILELLKEDVNYTFNFKDKKFRVRFDVNNNETKKGIKIQFTPYDNLAANPNDAKVIMNELQVLLNQKLAAVGMSVDFDPDVPFANTIGFTLKLGTISTFIINTLTGQSAQAPQATATPAAPVEPPVPGTNAHAIQNAPPKPKPNSLQPPRR